MKVVKPKHPSKLNTCRREKGLTLDDLAEKSGVSRNTIARLEAHPRNAITTTKTLFSLAKALECDPAELFLDFGA